MAAKTKSKFIINLEYLMVLAPIFIVRALPLKAAYFLSTFIFGIMFHLDFKHRKRCIQHILHSGICSTEKDAWLLARKNYRHFARVAVEILKTHQIVNAENSREYIRLGVGPELKRTCFIQESKEPVIIVTAHLGNWELAGNAYSWLSGFNLTSIMRALTNPRIGDIVYSHRIGLTHKTVSKSKGIKPLLAALKNGESIAIVADQHASTSEGVVVEVFGHPARAHATPALLHLKTGVPIIVGALLRLDDSFHFEFRGSEVIRYTPTGDKEKDIKEVTQRYSSALEAMIRETPEQWMWAHRRWLDINRDKRRKKGDNNHGKESGN